MLLTSRRLTIFAASGMSTLAILLGACAVEEPAVVKDKADTPAEVVESEEGATNDPTEDAAAEETEEQEATAALGDTVTVGSWDVKVTKVVLNANQAIAGANMFNDKPKGQYVLATYEATYTGQERTADAWIDLSWSFTTTDSQIHDQAMAVTPSEKQEWPTQARRGGTIRGQAVFDLKPNLVKGGLLTVEGYDDDFDTVYADFKI